MNGICETSCGDDRFELIAKAKAELLDATNIESNPTDMAALDSILFRCWQMGWLDHLRMERKEKRTIELLSCRFCDGKARLMAQHFTDDSHVYWVKCRKCGMEGPHLHDAEPAIAAWNSLIRERTCQNVDEAAECGYFICSECNAECSIEWCCSGYGEPRYCPSCGAVVE